MNNIRLFSESLNRDVIKLISENFMLLPKYRNKGKRILNQMDFQKTRASLPLNKQKIIKSLTGSLQIPKTFSHRLIKKASLRVQTDALKPTLTIANKLMLEIDGPESHCQVKSKGLADGAAESKKFYGKIDI